MKVFTLQVLNIAENSTTNTADTDTSSNFNIIFVYYIILIINMLKFACTNICKAILLMEIITNIF